MYDTRYSQLWTNIYNHYTSFITAYVAEINFKYLYPYILILKEDYFILRDKTCFRENVHEALQGNAIL